MADTASKVLNAATPTPTNKVIAGGVSGSIVVIAVYFLNTYFFADHKIPPEVSSAITVVAGFVCSYYTRPSMDQTTV